MGMMKNTFTFLGLFLCLTSALANADIKPLTALNLNVFDQLQGTWTADFRATRINALRNFVRSNDPDLVVFQEAQGLKLEDIDSTDAMSFPFRKFLGEMLGADGYAYGYWIGAKQEPDQWIADGFSFPGGVKRRVLGALWNHSDHDGKCLGVLSLHMSYQTTQVRQLEAKWLVKWVEEKKQLCQRWMIMGDFNADETNAEMKILFEAGFLSLQDLSQLKPTVGAFNPIRRIYGDNIPSRTIDWALIKNGTGQAKVVLDEPFEDKWISDHAGLWVTLN